MEPIKVEMTGTLQYQKYTNTAICGFAGAGKTIFGSTAPSPFYIFFKEHPQIMSIADRLMPHTKVMTEYEGDIVVVPIWDKLLAVIKWLESDAGDAYETIVVDTGDELFKAMKATRVARNGGKFPIGDWNWLAEKYRDVMQRILDMDKNVIVNYHLKNTQAGDEGEIVRELALQGQMKDEVPEWFDIVGVLDSWEEITDEGTVTHRGILTTSTPKYPFVKDHSGKLPKLFPLSKDFIGDYSNMADLIFATVPNAATQTLAIIDSVLEPDPEPVSPPAAVPTPDELAAKKGVPDAQNVEDPTPTEEETGSSQETGGDTPTDAPADGTPVAEQPAEVQAVPETAPEPSSERTTSPEEPKPAPVPEASEPTEAATQEVVEQLGATVVVDAKVCVECGAPIVKALRDDQGNTVADADGVVTLVADPDWVDLTQMRYGKDLCRDDFNALKEGK